MDDAAVESRYDLRRRYDQLRLQLDASTREKDKLNEQFKSLLSAFTTQRKALEVSITKNKRYEEQLMSLQTKNRDYTGQQALYTIQIDTLENDNKNLNQRLKREREALQIELEDKKAIILRYSAEVKEVTAQKASLKSQIDEYERKIKSLIAELEQQSKRHMKEVNEVHETYMKFKSQAAELKTRIQLY